MRDQRGNNGAVYRRTRNKASEELAQLGLQRQAALEPYVPTLWGQLQLRDWPFDLTQAPSEVLRKHFPTSRRLTANLIWQQLRYRQLGIPQQLATGHGELWYKLAPVLYRAGFLKRVVLAQEPECKSGFWYQYQVSAK